MRMSHVDQHGTPGMIGARWWEIYENTFYVVQNGSQSDYVMVRAGSGVIFNNHKTGYPCVYGCGNIGLREEDTGYPALYQVGRGKNQALDPAYVWGNDSTMPVGSGSSNVQVNRDYYLTQKPNYTPYTYPHPLISGTSEINVIGHLQERQAIFSVQLNPFNSSLLLTFHNPQKKARINVYSVDGRKVMTLNNIQSDKVEWKPKNLARGIYALELQADGKVFRQHICLVK
jgi:hypothetical protein